MKNTGLFILAVGLIITIFTAFSFITKEKIIDLGKMEITEDKSHQLAWSPLIGVAVTAVGGGFYLYGMNKPTH